MAGLTSITPQMRSRALFQLAGQYLGARLTQNQIPIALQAV